VGKATRTTSTCTWSIWIPQDASTSACPASPRAPRCSPVWTSRKRAHPGAAHGALQHGWRADQPPHRAWCCNPTADDPDAVVTPGLMAIGEAACASACTAPTDLAPTRSWTWWCSAAPPPSAPAEVVDRTSARATRTVQRRCSFDEDHRPGFDRVRHNKREISTADGSSCARRCSVPCRNDCRGVPHPARSLEARLRRAGWARSGPRRRAWA
jgi:hypothetical protein